MSIAMINRPPVAVYREEQWFHGWVYALLAAVAGLGFWAIVELQDSFASPPGAGWASYLKLPTAFVLGIGLPPVLVVGLLRMTTEVAPAEIRVSFGLVPTYRHVVPIDAIRSVEPVRYRPIRDCGGWGIRRGRHGERVFNARGDRAVRLTLHDDSSLLIGTQRPEDLARTIDRAVRHAA